MKTLLHKRTNVVGSKNFLLRLTLLVIALVSTPAVFGQTTIFNYQNTTATIPSGFVFTNNVVSEPIDKSTYLLVEAGATSDFIVTPNYDLSAFGSATLTVNVATFGSSANNPMKVEFSTNGGSTWNPTTYTTATPTSSTYITGGPIVIAQTFTTTTRFRFSNNGTAGKGVRIQNLKLDAAAAPITSATSGNWSNTASWVGGAVPLSGSNVIIATGHTVTMDVTTGGINTRNSGTSTIVNTGGTLATAVQYINNGTTTINGSFQLNAGGFTNSGNNFAYSSGKLIFNNTSSYGVNNTDQYWPTVNGPTDVTILQGGMTLNSGANRTVTGVFQTAAAVTLTGALSLNGTVRINTGGSFANAPTYGSASTLVYNTGAAFGRGNEWTTATSGAGYPANVQISNPGTVTTLNMGSTSAQASGSITVDASTILNTTSGGLTVLGSVNTNGTISLGGDVTLSGTTASNWVVGATATQTNNGKAVFFTGASGTQTITKTAGGTVFFDYLVINKAAGSVVLNASPATDVTINTTVGDVLQILNAGALDLNGRTLTLNNAGGNIGVNAASRSITSGVTGATLAITGAKAIIDAGTLVINTNVTTVLTAGFDFGVSKVTVNGILQLNGGGFASNGSAPTYASGSTLLFNTGGFYDMHNGSADVAGWFRNVPSTGTAQAGVPWNVTISNNTSVRYNTANTDNFPRYINGSLVINSGSAFTLGGISGTAGDFFLRANWSNSGTFTANSRLVSFNGTTAQTLTGATTFDFLTVSNTAGLTLQSTTSSIIVNQTLALSGKITMGANNLTITSSNLITGVGASIYVVTNGAGQLKRTVAGGAVAFNVGVTSYNPITFTNSGTSDTYGVNVVDGAVPNALDATKAVNRRWQVTEAVAGGSNLAIVAQYNTGETGANFAAGTNPKIGFYNGTIWTETGATPAGVNPFTYTSTSNLSPADLTSGTKYFALGKDNAFFSTASQFVITAITPTSPTQDSGFSVTVVSRDASNFAANVIANTSFTLSTNGNAGTIGGTTTGTILAGTNSVTVTGVTLNNFGTGVTITATRTAGDLMATSTSSTFTVLAKATQLAFGTAPPATGNVGTNLTTFTVEARRPDNSVDTNYTGNITISKASGTGLLTGTLTVAAVAGVATFSAAQFDTAGTFTISAASGSLTPVTSGNIVITVAPSVIAQFDFTTSPYVPVTVKNANVGVTDFAVSSGTLTTLDTSGSEFPNEPFVSGSTGWTSTTQAGAKNFNFTITANPGYVIEVTSLQFNALATSAGPSAISYNIAGGTATYTANAPSATLVSVNQNTSGLTSLSTIPVLIQGWLNGSRTSSGGGIFRIDDVIVKGYVTCIDPTLYAVTGGGTYCAGGSGVTVGLSGSQLNINYQLKLNGTDLGSPVSGTGAALTFGSQTSVGTYTVVASNTNGSCSLTQTMTGSTSVSVNTTTTWTGGTSTVWTNSANWSCGVPFATSDVVIGTGTFDPEITTTPTIASLTINSGASLRILSTYNLTITNGIVNNGTLTVANNANILQTNDVSNTGTGNNLVYRNSSSIMRQDYTLWSSPVEGQQLQAFSPQTLSTRFYTYSPSSNTYVAESATNNFVEGSAYLIRVANNHPITPTIWPGVFIGSELHNGPLSIGVTSATYNAVGNPYPSPISADVFITVNNVVEPLYFWRKTNNLNQALTPTTSYATYTKAGGAGSTSANSGDSQGIIPNGIIQVGQGFIAKSTTTSLSITNAMRVANTQNQFLRTEEDDRSRFWLDMDDNNGFGGQMMVAYMPGATMGMDSAIDGRFFNDVQTALTSLVDDIELTIQGRALPFATSDVVPLGMKSELGGNFTISLNSKDGFFATEGTPIYLKDNLQNIVHDLIAGPYSFASAPGVFNTRFEVVYENLLTTVQPTFDASQVVVYKLDQNVVINTGKTTMDKVQIYDIRGRLLLEQININATELKLNTGTTNAVLIVKITSVNNVTVTRKIVN